MPPDKPVIRDRDGAQLLGYEIGSYEVDEDLVLDCDVTGGEGSCQVWCFLGRRFFLPPPGVPVPKVTWWKGGNLLDSSDEVLPRLGVVRNRLVYRGLKRKDLGARIVCQAVNNNKTLPTSREVKVVLNRKFVLTKNFLSFLLQRRLTLIALRCSSQVSKKI